MIRGSDSPNTAYRFNSMATRTGRRQVNELQQINGTSECRYSGCTAQSVW